jgi:hypothetical protein
MTQRAWCAPVLIVLARAGEGERVLAGCKGGPSVTSFLNHFDQCHSDAPECTTLCRDTFTS